MGKQLGVLRSHRFLTAMSALLLSAQLEKPFGTCSRSPELIRLQNGYIRTRATLTVSAPLSSELRHRSEKSSRSVQMVNMSAGATAAAVVAAPMAVDRPLEFDEYLDEQLAFASSNSIEEESEPSSSSSQTASGQSDGQKYQQLSFLGAEQPSRLVIKTEAIYPIEFEHLDQTGAPIVYPEPSTRKIGKKKTNSSKHPSYKVQARGSKDPGYFQFNANSSVHGNDVNNITKVLEKLLHNYDSNQRPGHGDATPALITSNIHIRSMGPMSELNNEYSLDCYFRQKWTDQRLAFESNQPFLSLNIMMLEKIWKPDTYFYNGKGSYLHTITRPNKFLRIYKDGGVYYSMRLTVKARCPMRLRNFPMDKQSCPLVFGSYGYTNDQLRYQWDHTDPVSLNEELVMSQFDLINPIQYRNSSVFFSRANYSVLQVNFNLIRHTGYFLIQVYVPCALIVVLSWVSFWINREATADRVGLGITTVLTLSTFGMDTRTDLPKVSYPTALDWFVIMCFSFVSSTLLEFASVHYFTKIGFGEVPVIEMDDEDDQENFGHRLHRDKGLHKFSSGGQHRSHPHLRTRRSGSSADQYRQQHSLHIISPPSGFSTSVQSAGSVLQNRRQNVVASSNLASNAIEAKYFTATPLGESTYCLPPRLTMDTTGLCEDRYFCPKHGDDVVEEEGSAINDCALTADSVVNLSQRNIYGDSLAAENAGLDDEYTDYESEDDESDSNNFNASVTAQPTKSPIPLENGRHWKACCWSRVAIKAPRGCRMFLHCLTGSDTYRKKMRKRAQGRGAVNSVSVIDKISRILFPASFVLLNLFYWLSYGHDRNRPFDTWKDGSPMFKTGS